VINDYRALFWKAIALWADDSATNAIDRLERVSDNCPYDWLATFYKGDFRFRTEDYGIAIEYCQKSLSLCKWNVSAMALIARSYIKQQFRYLTSSQDYTEALEVCEQILALNPKSGVPAQIVSEILEEKADDEKTLAFKAKLEATSSSDA
jgi:tetratricopeptide (TPR) repeat protein